MIVAQHAQAYPDKAAVVMADTGESITFRQLNERSDQLARYLAGRGLRPGDGLAILMENNLHFPEVTWAAMRSGLILTTVNRYLPVEDIAYIVNNSRARAIVTSAALSDVVHELLPHISQCETRLLIGGEADGWTSYEDALSEGSSLPEAEDRPGRLLLYSSGTTGRPKGIQLNPPGLTTAKDSMSASMAKGYAPDSISLSTAPLYHAAPLGAILATHSAGGTAVIMPRFDPEKALEYIERYKITESQWVPTMFVRMLKLPEDVRQAYDLSSMRVATHGAAPCAVEVKRRIIEWWGPILFEYFGSTESAGGTAITSEEWLRHPGSVGRVVAGELHICDDDGNELPAGEPGLIYFKPSDADGLFEYRDDPQATAESRHPLHASWATVGDMGYLDQDDYLYLTDRKTFMIISGGVNIYPQAIEDCITLHPKVEDVAVIGVPDAEMGEVVKAIVQPIPGVEGSAELASEILAYAGERLARFMVPKSVDFTRELPRLPTGKLYKRLLRDQYWQTGDAKTAQKLIGA